ncbi:MAG: transposase [Sarcina sp.]
MTYEYLVSPANIHDGRLAAPLITKYRNTFSEINTSNYIMDSGYDYLSLYRFIIDEIKSNPIIAYNKRGAKAALKGLMIPLNQFVLWDIH